MQTTGIMTAMLRRISRIPPGPHFMPCAAEYGFALVTDGKVIARTRYHDRISDARAAALALAKRRGITILGDLL